MRPPRARIQRQRSHSWKVAYADFATAMMALFIVLWMMNASSAVKRSVAGYFRDPRGYSRSAAAGPANAGEGLPVNRQNAADLQRLMEQALRSVPDIDKLRSHIQLSVTGEGLRIDLMENEQGLFFVTGSGEPTAEGRSLLAAIANQLTGMPNTIVVEGHTDSQPFRNASPIRGYTNWELSTDRANAARRALCAGGVSASRIVEIRGFADQKLFDAAAPESPRNRRISIVVRVSNE